MSQVLFWSIQTKSEIKSINRSNIGIFGILEPWKENYHFPNLPTLFVKASIRFYKNIFRFYECIVPISNPYLGAFKKMAEKVADITLQGGIFTLSINIAIRSQTIVKKNITHDGGDSILLETRFYQQSPLAHQ